MEIVAHRVNSIERVAALDARFGAEIDIRSRKGRLVLNHEPHAEGPGLEGFLDAFARTRRGRILILNVKEDGLDGEVLPMLAERGIERFFFLDLTYPSTVRLAVRGRERRIALRVSEYEPAAAALLLARRVDWVWLDCFSGKPAQARTAGALGRRFKVCLVSPELEGYPPARIAGFRPLGRHADAVCTKHPELWL
ncbi:MAG: hypothetical protein HY927_07050 [Elusimicrobia bacterium]|nr:hypothetical protein [Elusimicrobiota bacterium]